MWAFVFSYALPAISSGPVLTIIALYLNQRLQLTQPEVNNLVWIPPLTWGIGYFFWGWAADRYAENNARPVGMFLLSDGYVAHTRNHDVDVVGAYRDRVDVVFDLHRRRLSDARLEGGVVRLSA